MENLEEIIDGSDGVMVARGDLGMEIPIQKVVVLQKYISDRAINKGRFVICATQMLESMEQKPRPTRAEVSDITNSVYDLTDANMTSGETTNGKFPIECARLLRKVPATSYHRSLKKQKPPATTRLFSTIGRCSFRIGRVLVSFHCPLNLTVILSSLKLTPSSSFIGFLPSGLKLT